MRDELGKNSILSEYDKKYLANISEILHDHGEYVKSNYLDMMLENADMVRRSYHNITYPRFLQKKFIWNLWKKVMCKYGYHLWDEVASDADHYLYCDACEKSLKLEN